MGKEFVTRLTKNWKTCGKRGISFALIFAMLIGYVCWDGTEPTPASEEVLEMPRFQYFNIMPEQIAEDASYYRQYHETDRCWYELGTNAYANNRTGYEVAQKSFTGVYSVLGNNYTTFGPTVSNNPRYSFAITLGRPYAGSVFADYSQKSQISMRLAYTKYNRPAAVGIAYTTNERAGFIKSDWVNMSQRKIGVLSEGIYEIYDVMLVFADLDMPNNNSFSIAAIDGVPSIWLECGEQIRPANYSITKSDLGNLQMKITLVPKLNQSEENAVTAIFKAVEVNNSDGKIGFKALNTAELKEIYGTEDDIPENMKSADELMNEEWRIIVIEDNSVDETYSLVTSVGETDLTVTSPITDMAGNPVELEEVLEYKGQTKLYLDAVAPAAVSSVLSGSMIKSDTDEEIAQADMFAGVGDQVSLNLKLSERVYLVDGASQDDVYLVWDVKDAQGNYITTKLQSIQTSEEVNAERVSILVFAPVVLEAGMQGTIKPRELVGSENLVDASNNKMNGSIDGAHPDKQIGVDCTGPEVTIGANVVTKIDTNSEKYYVFPIYISDGDDVDLRNGAGLLTSDGKLVTQYFTVSSSVDVADLKWQFAVTRDANDVTFESEANAITSAKQYEEFEVMSSGNYYLHLYLNAAENVEISDSILFNLDFMVSDAKNNQSTVTATTLSNMGLDGKAPLLVVTPQAVEVTRDEADENVNNVKFAAGLVASDLNAVKELSYQWVNIGEEPTANNWIVVTSGTTVDFTASVDFSLGNVATDVNKVLCVRAIDEAGNITEYRSEENVFSANVERVNARYEIVYDDKKAGGISDIKIFKSVASDGSESGYTRVIVNVGENSYVRVFDSASFMEVSYRLLDAEVAEWYQVEIDENTGKYASVSSEKTTLPIDNYYGVLNIQFAASAEDLTPLKDALLADPDDTTLETGREIEMVYTCLRDDVHNIIFTDVKDSAGNVLNISGTSENGVDYYKINQNFAGIKYGFTISNQLLPSLNIADVDFANSYAVIVKADANGNITTDVVSNKIALMSNTQQSVAVPYKDGGYETGVYAMVIYLAQKDGGMQEYTTSLFLVDNDALPEQFGVIGYDREVLGAYDHEDNRTKIDLSEEATEGDYLTSVNVGVATSSHEPTIVYIDGKPAFTRTTSNGLGLDGMVTITLRAETNGTVLLGETLGKVSGIRLWNQASKKGSEDIEWNTNGAFESVIIEDTYVQAELVLDMAEEAIVSAETLANLDWNTFKVKLGRNVICYQLRLENGRLSPVYTFEINLYDEAPEVEVSYAMENAFDITDYIYDEYYVRKIVGTEYQRILAKSYAFRVDSAFSEGGAITVYHAIHNGDTVNPEWEYVKVDPNSSTPIETEELYGYLGLEGTRVEYSRAEGYTMEKGVAEFFMVVDAVGNAYSYYPIINSDFSVGDTIQDAYGYPIWNEDDWGVGLEEGCVPLMTCFTAVRNIGELDATIVEPGWEYGYGSSYGIDFGENYPKEVFEKISVTVDEKEECFFEDVTDTWKPVINSAGIVFYDGFSMDMEFPYDASKAEGEMITHTVVIKGYIGDELAVDEEGNEAVQTFTVTAPNEKPAIVQEGTPEVGEAWILANTYLFAEGIMDEYERSFGLPVYANGTYTKGFVDIFGTYYELVVEITDMPADPLVDISTTEMTADPVEIIITSDGGIFTISPNTEVPSVAEVTGEDTSELKIVMQDNGYFEVICTYEDGSFKTIVIDVENIHNDPIEPEIVWSYSEHAVDKTDNSYIGEVTATLIDKNGSPLKDLETGLTPSVTFVPGGETTYTFTNYVNIVGVVGEDVEVVLPITLKEPEEVVEDTYNPDVAVTGFAKFQNQTILLDGAFLYEDEARKETLEDGNSFFANYEAIYGTDYIYDSIDDLVGQVAFAEKFIFTLEIGDENDVKTFIVKDKDAGAPDYATGASDAVAGVSLVGRTLQIAASTEFVLHLVDSKNNSTSLYFNITNLGDKAPAPTVTQTLTKNGDEVRVYLTTPNLAGVTDLIITNTGAQIEMDATSSFYGMPYMSFSQNYKDGVAVFYSYMYCGQLVEGSVIVYITEFDDRIPQVITNQWSANYGSNKYTNQNITAQFELSKPVGAVYPVDSEGNRILAPEGVTIVFLENKVTVIYEKNAEAICLKVTDAIRGSLTNTIDLPAITTIDKTAAQLTKQTEFSSNHRKLYVTITANETVTWPDGSVGTTYKFTASKNDEYSVKVSDKAGNISTITTNVTSLITEDLTLALSTGASDATIIDPATYQVDIGDALYVKTNRASVVTLNGNTAGVNVREGVWTEIVIEEDAEGLYPTIQAMDEYGNLAMVQLLQILIKDRVAPTILLNKNLVSASLEATAEELEELLRNNYVASDNETVASNLVFRYEIPNVQVAGTYVVTYYVEDEAGNVASTTGWIRFFKGEEVSVQVNGIRVERDETIVVSAGTQDITVVHNGEPYKVEWRKGLKSLGQMKNNANILTGYTEETEKHMTLELTETGYYTILLTTQGRDTYRLVIYVEE